MKYVHKIRQGIAELVRNLYLNANGDLPYQWSEIKEQACAEIVLEFLYMRDNNLMLEGHFVLLKDNSLKFPRVELTINGSKKIFCESVNRNDSITESYDKSLAAFSFCGRVADIGGYDRFQVEINLSDKNAHTYKAPIRTGSYFPFCADFENAYAVIGNRIAKLKDNILTMEIANEDLVVNSERSLCDEFLKFDDEAAREVVALRSFYHCYKAINKREIWLISDQWYRADDNGEAFFSYIQQHKKENQDVYFVLSRDSKDYERLSMYGNILEPDSFEHRLYRLLADKIILSHTDDIGTSRIFHNSNRYYQDICYRGKNIFLQHGITQNNIAPMYNRYLTNFSLLFAGGTTEREGFICGEYFYDDSVVKLTGFARYDNLTNKNNKTIIIMPTWRNNLADWSKINIDGTAIPLKGFRSSAFFKFYNRLINDSDLIETAKAHGYKIKLMAHPNVRPFLPMFDKNEYVEFCAANTRYMDLFAEGSLLITDYSSVAFDFAYLKKPVVYCQFDKVDFFSHHYKAGYFNYENDGFGEVLYDIDSSLVCIKDYIFTGCALKDRYRERIKKFFEYSDKNNCARIYDEILKLKDENEYKQIMETYDKEKIFNVISYTVKDDEKKSHMYEMTYRHMFPCHLFKPMDKVIIYGAGKVGLELYYQNEAFHFVKTVAIVDKNHDKINIDNLTVKGLDELASKEYDYILIAVLDEKIAEKIKNDLITQGVNEKKIKWDGERYPWLRFFGKGGFNAVYEKRHKIDGGNDYE